MINLGNAREWLGRVDVQLDQAEPAPLARLFATLDREDAPPVIGDALPPLAHWLYFLPAERRSEIGEDGRSGAFLPPIELARRVCAWRRIEFYRPLYVGDAISRVSRIVDVAQTPGRGGPRVSVLVRHEIGNGDGVALSEDQCVTFRRRSPTITERPRRRLQEPLWSRRVRIDEVTLFRYSALTFDAHRIHYDRRYAAAVEGQRGLIVQDGLVANLLLDLLRRHTAAARFRRCDFRSLRPLFDGEPFSLCGRPITEQSVRLWAEDAQGWLAMEAVATLSDEIAFGRAILAEVPPRLAPSDNHG